MTSLIEISVLGFVVLACLSNTLMTFCALRAEQPIRESLLFHTAALWALIGTFLFGDWTPLHLLWAAPSCWMLVSLCVAMSETRLARRIAGALLVFVGLGVGFFGILAIVGSLEQVGNALGTCTALAIAWMATRLLLKTGYRWLWEVSESKDEPSTAQV